MNCSKIKTFVMIMALGAAAVSCNQKDDNAKPALPKQATEQMAIRYIDIDTLLTKYNLAKDFDEAATTMQNNYDAAEKRYAQQALLIKIKRSIHLIGPALVYDIDLQMYQNILLYLDDPYY